MFEETLTNREYRWTSMSYDELSKVVNDAYRGNPDIRIRALAHELGLSFDVVWGCLGFRDEMDLMETGEE
mgnify:CR=1 FL=1